MTTLSKHQKHVAALQRAALTDEPNADGFTSPNTCARRANAALSAYVVEYGDPQDDRCSIQDLVSDIMHLCNAQGWDWRDVERMARSNHNAEVAELGQADADFAK
jgi:hypothetical protein